MPFFTLCLLLAQSAAPSAEAPTRPPNIVLILADDLGYGELGCYGQKKIRTPHVDRLAAEGMRFTQYYSGAPVCAPARCVLLTGKHLPEAQIRDNRDAQEGAQEQEGQWPLRAGTVTLASRLHEAGYATGGFGKWGLGNATNSGYPCALGFDTFYGYYCQRVAHSYFPPYLNHNDRREVLNQPPVPGHFQVPTAARTAPVDYARFQGRIYAPDRILEEALQFVREHREGPFFLYLPFVEPHVAMQPPPASVAKYPEAWDSEPYLGDKGYTPHPRPHAGYAAMISDLDAHVGAVMAELQALGIDQNTLVLFTSDNGPTHDVGGVDTQFFDSTAGLRGRKGSVFEGDCGYRSSPAGLATLRRAACARARAAFPTSCPPCAKSRDKRCPSRPTAKAWWLACSKTHRDRAMRRCFGNSTATAASKRCCSPTTGRPSAADCGRAEMRGCSST